MSAEANVAARVFSDRYYGDMVTKDEYAKQLLLDSDKLLLEIAVWHKRYLENM